MWGYLSQFWDAVSEVVVSGGTYTVDWFYSVGNAIAGAIGGMFDWLIHYVSDFFIFGGWIFTIIKQLILCLILPITFIFNFLKSFTLSAFANPTTPQATYSFSSQIMSVFATIPYWSVITEMVGVLMLIIVGIAVFRIITRIT